MKWDPVYYCSLDRPYLELIFKSKGGCTQRAFENEFMAANWKKIQSRLDSLLERKLIQVVVARYYLTPLGQEVYDRLLRREWARFVPDLQSRRTGGPGGKRKYEHKKDEGLEIYDRVNSVRKTSLALGISETVIRRWVKERHETDA